MKNKIRFWLVALFLVVLLTFQTAPVQAQCAMCTASVESSNNESGDSIANGLNKGILYLMAIPYVIAGCVGFFWYKYSRKK
ncbi:hypothetical protein [Rufibacter latericius]|uniref:Uncharacterized protein n=1 Tax=Rufibacter latericius TaxID=2487040 RepID=A0A3M9N1J5_9BACT|nr:hypothetical protein [Rufibacter latericius]RNI31669.1 hypothetical protein EFB08_00105 [Rufibacter latericius]